MELIVATDSKGAIGFENKLIIKNKKDMEQFVKFTKFRNIVMGRKTFESIGSKPLKFRTNYVLTRNKNLTSDDPDLIYINDLSEVPYDTVVIGGEKVYDLALKDSRLETIRLSLFPNIVEPVDSYFNFDREPWYVHNSVDYGDFKVIIYKKLVLERKWN